MAALFFTRSVIADTSWAAFSRDLSVGICMSSRVPGAMKPAANRACATVDGSWERVLVSCGVHLTMLLYSAVVIMYGSFRGTGRTLGAMIEPSVPKESKDSGPDTASTELELEIIESWVW